MDSTALTLSEAVNRYTATLKPEDRSAQHRELNKFLRWFDTRKPSDSFPVSEVKISDVTAYAEHLTNASGGTSERLQPVKAFFNYAHKHSWTPASLAPHIRIRKAATAKKQASEVQPRSVVRLTESGYHTMVAELEELRSRIPEITDEIQRAAADKDFRENAPLQAAREEQSKLVGRIQELESVLRSVEIIDENAAERHSGKAALGCTIIVHDISHDEHLRYTLVAGHEVDIRNGKMSVDSPIGRALLDRREGEEVQVVAPLGTLRLRIEKIET